jgi:hypothetical protein
MKVGTTMGGGDWPFVVASIKPVKVGDNWEYPFPVPIPEKIWEERARWPIGTFYWKELLGFKGGPTTAITPIVVDGCVEKVVLEGFPPTRGGGTLELQISKPGEPLGPYLPTDNRKMREETVLRINPYEEDFEEGYCPHCETEVSDEDLTCPECEEDIKAQVPPKLGDLVDKFGRNATIVGYFHDRDVSVRIRYALDKSGLDKERAEIQAKYDAEVETFKELNGLWDDLVVKINAYQDAKNEADERAQLAALKAKYDDVE